MAEVDSEVDDEILAIKAIYADEFRSETENDGARILELVFPHGSQEVKVIVNLPQGYPNVPLTITLEMEEKLPQALLSLIGQANHKAEESVGCACIYDILMYVREELVNHAPIVQAPAPSTPLQFSFSPSTSSQVMSQPATPVGMPLVSEPTTSTDSPALPSPSSAAFINDLFHGTPVSPSGSPRGEGGQDWEAVRKAFLSRLEREEQEPNESDKARPVWYTPDLVSFSMQWTKLEFTDNKIGVGCGMRACAISDTQIVLVGGTCDHNAGYKVGPHCFSVLNCETMTMATDGIGTSENQHLAIVGHSASCIQQMRSDSKKSHATVIVSGGIRSVYGRVTSLTLELVHADKMSPKVMEKKLVSNDPEFRDHSMTRLGSSSTHLIYGGRQIHSKHLNSHLYLLYPNQELVLLTTSGGPVPRYGHSATYIEGKVYVFGGKFQNAAETNELWMLFGQQRTYEWCQMERRGNVPSPRSYHTAIAMGHFLLIFGGVCEGVANNDLFLFDTRKEVWSRFDVPGEAPSPRSHAAACLINNSLFIYGGYSDNRYLGDCFLLQNLDHFGELEITPEAELLALVRKDNTYADCQFYVDEYRCPKLFAMCAGASVHTPIIIPSIPPHLFAIMLDFIYSDSPHVHPKDCRELTKIARLWGLPRLASIAEFVSELRRDVMPACLQQDLSRLLKESACYDLVVHCEGRKFYAHSVILTAASSFFRAMLCAGFAEAQEHSIELHEVSAESLTVVMQFLYGLTPRIHADNAVEVFLAADRLNIIHLRHRCEYVLSALLDRRTVVPMFSMAQMHKAAFLFQKTSQYVARHWDRLQSLGELEALEPEVLVKLKKLRIHVHK